MLLYLFKKRWCCCDDQHMTAMPANHVQYFLGPFCRVFKYKSISSRVLHKSISYLILLSIHNAGTVARWNARLSIKESVGRAATTRSAGLIRTFASFLEMWTFTVATRFAIVEHKRLHANAMIKEQELEYLCGIFYETNDCQQVPVYMVTGRT